MLDAQKRAAELLSSPGKVQELLDAQKRAAELLSSPGEIQELLDAQKRAAELLSSPTQVNQLIDAQKRVSEFLSSPSEIQRLIDGQRRLSELLRSQLFDRYQALAAETVDALSAAVTHVDPAIEPAKDDGSSWIPTREQALRLLDVATFLIALYWLAKAGAAADVHATIEPSIDALMAFAVLMMRYGGRADRPSAPRQLMDSLDNFQSAGGTGQQHSGSDGWMRSCRMTPDPRNYPSSQSMQRVPDSASSMAPAAGAHDRRTERPVAYVGFSCR